MILKFVEILEIVLEFHRAKSVLVLELPFLWLRGRGTRVL